MSYRFLLVLKGCFCCSFCWGFFVNGDLVCYFCRIIYPRFLQDNVETLGNVYSSRLIWVHLQKNL